MANSSILCSSLVVASSSSDVLIADSSGSISLCLKDAVSALVPSSGALFASSLNCSLRELPVMSSGAFGLSFLSLVAVSIIVASNVSLLTAWVHVLTGRGAAFLIRDVGSCLSNTSYA